MDWITTIQPTPSGADALTSASTLLPLERLLGAANLTESQFWRRRLDMSTEYFVVPDPPSTTTTTSTAASVSRPSSVHVSRVACTNCTHQHPNDGAEFMFGAFRNEVWVIPVLTLAGIVMLLICGFELFVIARASRTSSSRRHLFLGQMLLLGLFLCSLVSVIVAATPTPLSCALARLGIGVAYALVFASLLVKCVFLISLNSGVYLPATYQALLLLFSVLIQVAIAVQWLITNPPQLEPAAVERLLPVQRRHNNLLFTARDLHNAHQRPPGQAAPPAQHHQQRCRTPYLDLIFSLVYVMFLIIFVSALAFRARSIRSNYRESTYIGLSIGCSLPIWFLWVAGGFLAGDRYRDAALAIGLVCSAAVIFVVMFMPKGRQMSAIGKDGVYKEDREDQFSSISRTGSRYSPSFFHFKPVVKCAGFRHCVYEKHEPGSSTVPEDSFHTHEEHNLYTTLEPTLSSNPNVYFQCSNGVHPGMIY